MINHEEGGIAIETHKNKFFSCRIEMKDKIVLPKKHFISKYFK